MVYRQKRRRRRLAPALSTLSVTASVSSAPDDAHLVLQARTGKRRQRHAAFAILVRRHEVYLRNMLRQLCRDTSLAEELAQESFVAAWTKLDTLHTPGRFRAWLKQLAYRRFLGLRRRQKVERAYARNLEEPVVNLGAADDLETLLNLCTPSEREVILLTHGFGFTYRELAEARDVPEGTVKAQAHRAKQKMRQYVEASGQTVERQKGNESQ